MLINKWPVIIAGFFMLNLFYNTKEQLNNL